MTVRDLIKGSLRLIGVVASGETPDSSELADGLFSLNSMISSWSTERLIIYSRTREEFNLVGGTGSYTIGVGGDFNTARPMVIEKAAIEVQVSSPYEVPVDIINTDDWANLLNKGLTSALPLKLYAEGNYPLDTLNLWPVPSDANKLVLYTQKPLSAFTGVTETIALPPGYEDALRYNLAVRMAPEFNKQVDQVVIKIAIDSKANIKRQNITAHYLDASAITAMGNNNFNILTGE
jgi:hypothetical protein